VQYGFFETGILWLTGMPDLPSRPTYAEDPDGLVPRITASNYQHPDHDTEEWPAAR
jgi:hypothetical protein